MPMSPPHKLNVVVAGLVNREILMSYFRHYFFISLLCLLWHPVHAAFEVRVGVLQQVPLIMEMDQAFEQGLAIDLLKQIAQIEKWQIHFNAYPYEEGMQALLQGEIQVFVGVNKQQIKQTRQYTELYVSQQSIVERWGQVYQAKTQPIKQYKDLDEKRIGFINEAEHYASALVSICHGLHIDCEFIQLNEIDAVFAQLKTGDIQAAILPRLSTAVYERNSASVDIQRSPLLLNPDALYAISSARKNGHIIDSIDWYLNKWQGEKTPHYFEIQTQWLGTPVVKKVKTWSDYLHWYLHLFALLLLALLFYGYLRRKKQKKAQQQKLRELTQSEALYRNLVETMPYGLEELDLEGRILFCNQADQRIRRYLGHELIGQSVVDMVLSEEQRHLFAAHIKNLIDKQPDQPEPFYLTISRKDGLTADIRTDLSYKHSPDGHLLGFFSTLTDITGLKETKDRIKNYHVDLKRLAENRRAELRSAYNDLLVTATVFENTTEAIMVLNLDGHFSATNPAFTQITGYPSDHIKGKHFSALVAENKKQPADLGERIWQSLKDKGQWQNEIWSQRADGSTYPAWVSLNEVEDAKNHTSQYVALLSDITRRKQYEKQIWRQANYDALTNLPNRHLFHRRMEQALTEAGSQHGIMSLMFIDLDHFKEVNDSMGHDAGDELLKAATQRIRTAVRPQDTIARMGGDEFTVILPSPIERKEVKIIAETIIQTLTEAFPLSEGQAYISASIGIVCYPEHGENVSTLLKNADIAMYQVKEAGRGDYGVFQPEDSS